jgi:hypothetical protein
VIIPLRDAIGDQNGDVSKNARLAFDALTGGSITEGFLNQTLKSPHIEIRKCAIHILGQLRMEEPLIKVLEDNNETPSVRESAASTLAMLGKGEGLNLLFQALNDSDFNVRAQAAIDLGDIGNKSAVDPLIRSLKDENSEVRIKVALALGLLNDTRSVKSLREIANGDTDSYVRNSASKAIKMMEGPTEVPYGETEWKFIYCTIPVPEGTRLYINIISIRGMAAPGNSQTMTVTFNIIPNLGLDLEDPNIKLDVLKVPSSCPKVEADGVGGYYSGGVPIYYTINIGPAINQEKEYTWVPGTYTFKLHCISNAGKELANKTFSFSVVASNQKE